MYPAAGQQISPGLLQALQDVSSTDEDSANLEQQMKLAQALRPSSTMAAGGNAPMAGRVAVRTGPVGAALKTIQSGLAGYEQGAALNAMKAQATKLRDARGRIISAETAAANAQHNPDENHPDTNAALGVTSDDPGFGMGASAGSAMMPDLG